MWDGVTVVQLPDQVNLGDIVPVVELVEKLEEQGIILYSEVNDTQTTIFLGRADHIPSSKRVTLNPIISPFLP